MIDLCFLKGSGAKNDHCGIPHVLWPRLKGHESKLSIIRAVDSTGVRYSLIEVA